MKNTIYDTINPMRIVPGLCTFHPQTHKIGNRTATKFSVIWDWDIKDEIDRHTYNNRLTMGEKWDLNNLINVSIDRVREMWDTFMAIAQRMGYMLSLTARDRKNLDKIKLILDVAGSSWDKTAEIYEKYIERWKATNEGWCGIPKPVKRMVFLFYSRNPKAFWDSYESNGGVIKYPLLYEEIHYFPEFDYRYRICPAVLQLIDEGDLSKVIFPKERREIKYYVIKSSTIEGEMSNGIFSKAQISWRESVDSITEDDKIPHNKKDRLKW
jgi:hypothetical protein